MNALATIAAPPLPSALEAEHALLGVVLFDNAALKHLGEVITPESFGEPYHARLWEMITGLIERGRLADGTALAARLQDDQAFHDNGGLRFFADLIDRSPIASQASEFARRVNDAARRREIIRIAGEAMNAARDPEQEPFAVLTEIDTQLSALTVAAAPDGHTLIDARDAADELVRELDHEAATGESPGLLSGIDCIDKALGGMFPNELLILGGRPSMGKTALARAIAFAIARRYPSLLVPVFALEMDRRQISRRNLSALSFEAGPGIAYRDMKRGRDLSGEDRAHLAEMGQRVPRNMMLDDTAILTLEHVRRRCMSLSKRGKIGLIVIDYLQIMDMPGIGFGMNMTTALGQITKGLKQLAKQLACTILLLSQLSRKVEERDNKRPVLSDLRESGSIEQDASVVLFAYREAYYLEREGPRKGTSREEHDMALASCARTMEVICGKSREGPVGTTRQRYFAECDVIQNEESRYG